MKRLIDQNENSQQRFAHSQARVPHEKRPFPIHANSTGKTKGWLHPD